MNEVTDNTTQVAAPCKYALLGRVILALVFPPLAVFDRGCLAVTLVYIMTVIGFVTGIALFVTTWGFAFFTGWIPAALVALLFCCKSESVDTDKGEEAVQIGTTDIFSLLIRYLLCLIFPPISVIDKGCGSVIAVFFFTLFGWLPGVILAFLITLKSRNYYRIKK